MDAIRIRRLKAYHLRILVLIRDHGPLDMYGLRAHRRKRQRFNIRTVEYLEARGFLRAGRGGWTITESGRLRCASNA